MTIVVAGRGRPGTGFLSISSDWNFLAVMQTGPTSTCCRRGSELLDRHSACLHKFVILNCITNVMFLDVRKHNLYLDLCSGGTHVQYGRGHVLLQDNCAFLGYYAASSGSSLPKFRDNLLFPSSRVKNPRKPLKMVPVGCSETSVSNYQY